MNSMKRRMRPLPRKKRASSSTSPSFSPRCTTQLILMGNRPTDSAASIPARTSSGPGPSALRPDSRRKRSGSRLSRLTVTRPIPASASGAASFGRRRPLVVSAISSMPSMARRRSIRFGSSRRSSGSPPVMRIFRTPSVANIRARRSISSKRNTLLRGRKLGGGESSSAGMQ